MSDFLSPAINDVLKGDDMEFRDKVGRIVGTAILKNDKNYTDDMIQLFLDTIEKAKPPLPYAGDHYNDGFIRAVDEFEERLKKEIGVI